MDEPSGLERTVQSYVDWLEIKAPDHHRDFVRRLTDDPEAAHAEAVTFSILRTARLRPRPAEVIGVGGVDFLCEPSDGSPFAVEVTTLETSTVAKASGLPHQNGKSVRSFRQITTNLLREAINKAPQMANHSMPRLLVLATEHDGGEMLMGTHSAEELLTGSTAFQVRIGEADASPETITSLKNSVFCRPSRDGSVEPCRQSISAILLITISPSSADVIGLLHPAPAVPFDPDALDQVHFLRFRSWPIEPGRKFGIEWIGPPPRPSTYYHLPIEIEDNELRVL